MNHLINNLSLFLKRLPNEPGIYKMMDANHEVLYVGKARDLKKRVSSYFTKKQNSNKIKSLISQVLSVDIHITRSEIEALLLESSLIKSLHPKYNVLLRDDKSYPYICVSHHKSFPRMEIRRFKKKPTNLQCFGPYPSASAVKETLNTIQKIFKIRNCRDAYFNARTRPCLQYQIKRCSAPCTHLIDSLTYRAALDDAMHFLEGKSQRIIKTKEQLMFKASESLDFEQAAHLRDQIKKLRLIQEQQSMIHMSGDADVIVIHIQQGIACVQCVTIREGQVLSSQSYFPKMTTIQFQTTMDELWESVFMAFISHRYIDSPERIPPLIITDTTFFDKAFIEELLSSLREKKVKVQTLVRGVKAKWLDFANHNLQRALSEKHSSANLIKTRYLELAKLLKIDSINRMECFDISHTSGQDTKASCVVFDETGPAKSLYRQFNIDGITPGDDYAAIENALKRRFKRLLETNSLPDVLIIDGGKGQVSRAESVLNELKINTVCLVGVAKGPTRKAGWEQLILCQQNNIITLPEVSPALHLIQHIRDEAHRFAITAHRKKRDKTSLQSSINEIEGVGPKRRQALLLRFGGVRELSRASIDEIAKTEGISPELAQKIYQYFHQE